MFVLEHYNYFFKSEIGSLGPMTETWTQLGLKAGQISKSPINVQKSFEFNQMHDFDSVWIRENPHKLNFCINWLFTC